jgi:hypothetical protein
MSADSLVSRVRDWLNAGLGHRRICVHLRSFAAKIPFFLTTQPQLFLTTQPQPDAARQGPGHAHPHPAPNPAAATPFKPSRTDPLNREPEAKSGPTAPFQPFRTDPLNREPTAKPGATAPFKPFRTDPLNLTRPRLAPQPRRPPPPQKPRAPPRARRPPRAQGNPVKQASPGALSRRSASRPMSAKAGNTPWRLSGQRPDLIAPATS